jgi:hypothetical protein
MADLATPHYGFPFPDPDDPLGGVDGTIEALALAVEDRFRRTHDANSSVTSLDDTTMPSAAGTYELALGGGKASFVAPANMSGRVRVTVSAILEIVLSANVTRELWLSAAIYEGPTSSPGAQVDAPNDTDAIMLSVGATSGMRNAILASFEWVSATLTPGDQYHIRLFKKVSATTSHTIRLDNATVRVFTR